MGNQRNKNCNKDDASFKGQRSRNACLRKIKGLKIQATQVFQKSHRLRNAGLESLDKNYGKKVVDDLAKNLPRTCTF